MNIFKFCLSLHKEKPKQKFMMSIIKTDICRGCLCENKETFENLWKDGNSNLFSMCTNLQVAINDGLPQNICTACIYKCLMWDNFKKQCINSESTLRRLFKIPDNSSSLIVLPENKLESNVISEQIKNFESIVTIIVTDDTYQHVQPESLDGTIADEPKQMHVSEHTHLKNQPEDGISKPKANKCNECGQSFRNSDRYHAHLRMHQGLSPEVCQICSKEFSNSRALRRHKVKHDDTKKYNCKDCSKTYKYATSLTLHKKIHENSHEIMKRFMCSLCGKNFLRNHGLQSHLLSHQTEKAFKCAECDKFFKSLIMLKNHQQRHAGLKNFDCSECCKKFITSAELRIHQRSHTDIKPYVCSVLHCKKSYKTKSHLAVHRNVFHDGIKKYACDLCSLKFGHKKVLKQHRLIHSNEKPHQCSICHREFRQKSTLTVHMSRAHKEDMTFKNVSEKS